MKNVTASDMEAELGPLFVNYQQGGCPKNLPQINGPLVT